MKRGLIIISAPQFMLQSMWFCAMHPERKYDAYILQSDIADETVNRMIQQCRESEWIEQIYLSDGFKRRGFGVKAILLLKMILWYCIGRKSALTRRLINCEVDGEKYDMVLVDNECSVFGGAIIDHADQEYDVYIMQEGFADIQTRESFPRPTLIEFAYWLVASMGYTNPGLHYKLKKVKYCTKITTLEPLLEYRPFKRILSMDIGSTNHLYREYLSKAYGYTIPEQEEADVLLLTTDFENMNIDYEVVEQLRAWMAQEFRGKRIGLKKHPRDTYSYNWDEFEMREIDPSIPAELLLPGFRGKTVVSAYLSTTMAEVIVAGMDYRVLYFERIRDINYKNIFRDLMERLRIPAERIVKIE